jgi:hypothetical protein
MAHRTRRLGLGLLAFAALATTAAGLAAAIAPAARLAAAGVAVGLI